MSLNDLIEARKNQPGGTGDKALSSPAPSPTGMDSSPQADEPYGVQTSTTPSGLEIYYQAGPKRLYRIRDGNHDYRGPDPNDMDGEKWGPGDWHEVPSVSTVLDCLAKDALPWWGMRMGVQGVLDLLDNGALEAWEFETDEKITEAEIVDRLKQHKLTVNHKRDKAADRGTNVHTALETWVETGVTPNPEFFPENERGYVEGLVAFINDAHPHPLASELMVASTEGYAGRFDLLANLDFAGEVVVKTYPKREPKREQVNGVWLLDLKTSKAVYETYHLQLAAYWYALVECGYQAPNYAGVVRVTDDGRYELVKGKATEHDFFAILEAYEALQGIKK